MYEARGFLGGFYAFSEWVFRLMYVHFLWILFSLLGLGIFGFMPATVAVFTIIRQWLMKKTDISIFPYFWKTYKESWIQVNLIGLLLVGIGIFLYIDLKISQQLIRNAPLHFVLLVVFLFYLFTWFYFFPVYVHFDLKPFQYVKQAFLFSLFQPLNTIVIALWMIVVYLLLLRLPAVFLFLGVSITAFPIMWFCYLTFRRLEKKLSK